MADADYKLNLTDILFAARGFMGRDNLQELFGVGMAADPARAQEIKQAYQAGTLGAGYQDSMNADQRKGITLAYQEGVPEREIEAIKGWQKIFDGAIENDGSLNLAKFETNLQQDKSFTFDINSLKKLAVDGKIPADKLWIEMNTSNIFHFARKEDATAKTNYQSTDKTHASNQYVNVSAQTAYLLACKQQGLNNLVTKRLQGANWEWGLFNNGPNDSARVAYRMAAIELRPDPEQYATTFNIKTRNEAFNFWSQSEIAGHGYDASIFDPKGQHGKGINLAELVKNESFIRASRIVAEMRSPGSTQGMNPMQIAEQGVSQIRWFSNNIFSTGSNAKQLLSEQTTPEQKLAFLYLMNAYEQSYWTKGGAWAFFYQGVLLDPSNLVAAIVSAFTGGMASAGWAGAKNLVVQGLVKAGIKNAGTMVAKEVLEEGAEKAVVAGTETAVRAGLMAQTRSLITNPTTKVVFNTAQGIGTNMYQDYNQQQIMMMPININGHTYQYQQNFDHFRFWGIGISGAVMPNAIHFGGDKLKFRFNGGQSFQFHSDGTNRFNFSTTFRNIFKRSAADTVENISKKELTLGWQPHNPVTRLIKRVSPDNFINEAFKKLPPVLRKRYDIVNNAVTDTLSNIFEKEDGKIAARLRALADNLRADKGTNPIISKNYAKNAKEYVDLIKQTKEELANLRARLQEELEITSTNPKAARKELSDIITGENDGKKDKGWRGQRRTSQQQDKAAFLDYTTDMLEKINALEKGLDKNDEALKKASKNLLTEALRNPNAEDIPKLYDNLIKQMQKTADDLTAAGTDIMNFRSAGQGFSQGGRFKISLNDGRSNFTPVGTARYFLNQTIELGTGLPSPFRSSTREFFRQSINERSLMPVWNAFKAPLVKTGITWGTAMGAEQSYGYVTNGGDIYQGYTKGIQLGTTMVNTRLSGLKFGITAPIETGRVIFGDQTPGGALTNTFQNASPAYNLYNDYNGYTPLFPAWQNSYTSPAFNASAGQQQVAAASSKQTPQNGTGQKAAPASISTTKQAEIDQSLRSVFGEPSKNSEKSNTYENKPASPSSTPMQQSMDLLLKEYDQKHGSPSPGGP